MWPKCIPTLHVRRRKGAAALIRSMRVGHARWQLAGALCDQRSLVMSDPHRMSNRSRGCRAPGASPECSRYRMRGNTCMHGVTPDDFQCSSNQRSKTCMSSRCFGCTRQLRQMHHHSCCKSGHAWDDCDNPAAPACGAGRSAGRASSAAARPRRRRPRCRRPLARTPAAPAVPVRRSTGAVRV